MVPEYWTDVSTVLSWLPKEVLFVRGALIPMLGRADLATVFRDQDLNIQEQLDIARHFGPLHKHATTPIPKEPGLEEVHGQLGTHLCDANQALTPTNSRIQ